MTSRAQKLLEQMRQSKTGWRTRDLKNLYRGYGFDIRHGSKHDVVVHPEYPELRATLPRSRELAVAYVRTAINLVDRLLELKEESK